MFTSVNDWVNYLQTADKLLCVPLCVGGLALMFFGWRMWKATVVISYALIGTAVGAMIVGPGPNQLVYAISAGTLLAVLSYFPVNHSLAFLGALVGCGFTMTVVESAGIRGPMLWITGALALLSCGAVAFINRQLLVIAVTSFLGAVLLMSGLTVVATHFSTFYGTLRYMSSNSAIVLPFVLIVPTVMSCFIQVAEVHKTNAQL